MARTTTQHRGYPFAVLQTDTGFAAGGLQFAAMATAATMEELRPLLEQQVALYLLDCYLDGDDPVAPQPEDQLDLTDYREEDQEPEIVYAEPAPMSAISIAIEEALRQEGISYAELARRMGVPRSVITRITNPFYFAHTSRTLRGVAEALDRTVHVSLDKANHRNRQPPGSPPLVAV